MRRCFLSGPVLIWLIVTPVLAATNLTMEQAIELGLTRNEELLKARESRESARERVKEARGALFPNVEASYDYTRYFELPSVPVDVAVAPDASADGSLLGIDGVNPPGPDNPLSWHLVTQDVPPKGDHEHSFGVTVSQVIYSSGRIMNYYRSAKSGASAADLAYDREVRQLVFRIREAYLNALLAMASRIIAGTSLENMQKDHDLVEQKHKEGLASQLDLMQHRVELHTRRINLMTAENAAILSGNHLKALIGVPYEEDMILTDVFNDVFPTFEFEELKTRMLNAEPALKASLEAIRANEYMLGAVKADYYPLIAAFGSAQRSGDSNGFFPNGGDFDTTAVAGLRISIPIYEGGVKTAKKNQAIRDLNKSRLELANLRKMLVLDLQNHFLGYQTACKELDMSRETVMLAQKAYELAQLRYRTGLGNSSELRDAELAVTQARLLQSRIARDVNLNLYKILSYVDDNARSRP